MKLTFTHKPVIMKRVLLFGAAVAASVLSTNAQTTVNLNADFEDWVDIEYYDLPEISVDLDHSNIAAFITHGQPNITEVDGRTGSAMSLETIVEEADSTVGFIIYGKIEDGDNLEFSGGTPVTTTSRLDSIIGWFRYDIPAGDSAWVIVGQRTLGIPTGLDLFKITGSSNNWTRMAFPLGPTLFNAIPDTVVIGFTSSNPEDGGPLKQFSWLEVDDIKFVNGAMEDVAIENGDFELWETEGSLEAVEWESSNLYSPNHTPVERSTDAVEGDFAMKITTQPVVFGDVPMGFARLGEIEGVEGEEDSTVIGPRFPVTGGMPSSLTIRYKYTPNGVDSAAVLVAYTKWDAVEEYSEVVGWSLGVLPATGGGYDSVEVLTQVWGEPDSLAIVLQSSRYDEDESPNVPKEGSAFWVDGVFLTTMPITATTESILDASYSVFPNPAHDVVTIQSAEGQVLIHDATGQVVKSTSSTDDSYELALPSGMYFVEFLSAQGEHLKTEKLIIE